MARIEQIIPKLIPGEWESGAKAQYVYKTQEGSYNFSVDERLEFLLKNLNGTYSFAEIIRTLYGKEKITSLSLVIDTLASFCEKGMFVNNNEVAEAIQQLLEGKKANREGVFFKTDEVDEKFFSVERLLPLLKRTVLNAKNDEGVLKKIIKASEVIKVGTTTVLIREGEVGDELFVLLTGQLGVFKDQPNGGSPVKVNSIGPITVFGESSALLEKKRNATIIPLEESWVLRVPTQKLINVNKEVNFNDPESIRAQILINQILLMAPIFQGLSADAMQGFMQKCQLLSIEKDKDIICKAGADSSEAGIDPKSFYFVLEGALSVTQNEKNVGNLVKGDYFGEVGGVNKMLGFPSIRTLTDCLFLNIASKDLYDVLSKNFSLALQIEDLAGQRTKELGTGEQTMSSFHYDFDDESAEFTLTDIKYG